MAVTLYVPAIAEVALELTVGFWLEEVKLLGPDHEYVAPDIVEAVRDKVEPPQTGPLLAAVGAEGIAFIVAATDVLGVEVQLPVVASA